MSRRARFFAVQALLTAVLMGVIVVTLISPNGDNTLFGVDVPGAGIPVAQGPPTYEPADAGSQEARGGASGRAEGGSAAGEGEGIFAPPAAGAAAGGAAGGVEGPPPGEPPAPADEGPEGPADEQYGDTLARLSDAVH